MFGFGQKPKKTAVLVIPPKQYDEEELHTLEKELKHQHIKYIHASTSILGPITGIHGKTIKPEVKLIDVKIEEIDGIIFVGGIGAREIYNDMNVHRVIQKANQLEKIIGAIDYAPIILAHAEILNKKCATVLATEEQKLQTSGAHYTATPVEIEGNIITASSPAHAQEFANLFARMILGESVAPHEIGA